MPYLKPTHIVLHHSLTADGMVVDTKAIAKYHVEVKKFDCIGYHFLIEKVADNFYAILFGRPLWKPGAHEPKMNSKSIGICVVGNFDIEPPSQEQYDLCTELCAWLCHIYSIPVQSIRPHSEFSPKTCPGLKFDMDYVRRKTGEKLLQRWS